MGEVVFAKPGALIRHAQLAPLTAAMEADPHHPTIGAVAQGVIKKVEQGPVQAGIVAAQPQLRWCN